MDKIILIGGGGHCKVILSQLKQLNEYSVVGIIDNTQPIKSSINGVRVIGNDNDLEELYKKGIGYAFIAVGSVKDNSKRRKLFDKTKKIGYKFPVLISRNSIIDNSVEIGKGTIVMPGAVINVSARIGDNCIINTGAIIEHDCKIGSHVHIAPGVSISGDVEIGEQSFVGIGSVIIQGIIIGKNVTIGAGSVVIKDVPDNFTVVGNPVKEIGIKN
ncbi:putative acetyltransferase EpsM [subsurface metagenome]